MLKENLPDATKALGNSLVNVGPKDDRSHSSLWDGQQFVRPTDWSATRSIAAVWRNGAAYADSYRLIADTVADEARRRLAMQLET